jgi:hypothetical protein
VKYLERGCLRTHHDEAGNPYRWKVTSQACRRHGQSANRSQAVTVLERLQPPETRWLFAALPHGPGSGPASRSANFATTATTNNQLNELVGWVNRYCRDNHRIDTIPDVNGRPFRQVEHVTVGVLDSHRAVFAVACCPGAGSGRVWTAIRAERCV